MKDTNQVLGGKNECACGCFSLECPASPSCITKVPIFNHLEWNQMQEVIKVKKSATYNKGEMLYRAGDKDDSLYIVNEGKVKIYHLSESGKEQLSRILNPGDFAGELALFRESIHQSYAEAMTKTSVCIVRRDDLRELLIKYPTIALEFLMELSRRLEVAEKQSARFATEKVETRLALFLAECLKDDDNMEIELPMSKKDLASYLGTTPETISRRLSDLEALGYIRQKGSKKIVILDLEGLLLV